MAELSTDWSSLHQTARREESKLLSNLESLTKVANSVAKAPKGDVESNPLLGGMEMIDRLQNEIQRGLKLMEDTTMEMRRHESSGRPAHQSMLQKFEAALRDHQGDFRKIRRSIQEQRQSAELMDSVRRDINDFHEGAGVDALSRERAAIENSAREVEIIMSQGKATQREVANQRSMLSSVGTKLREAAEKFPVVRNVMGQIKSKRQREQLILASVTAFCMLFLLWWLM